MFLGRLLRPEVRDFTFFSFRVFHPRFVRRHVGLLVNLQLVFLCYWRGVSSLFVGLFRSYDLYPGDVGHCGTPTSVRGLWWFEGHHGLVHL